MYTQGDTSSVLLPIKFSLIFIQNVLVYTILKSKQNYIYTEVGVTSSEEEKIIQQRILTAGCYAIMGLIYTEFIFMLVGFSVPFKFAKWNLL